MAASDDECTENRRPKKKRSPKDKASLSMHLPSNKKTYNGDLVAHFPTRVKEVGGGGRPARRSSKSEEAVKVRLKLAGKGVRFKTHSNTSRKRSASLINDSERRRQKREQKATGAPLMSLGIVEWRRRQQWNPTCSDETNLSSQETAQEKAKGMSTEEVIATLSTNASETEVSINLPVWDSVNPMPCVKQRPAVMERRRHSDDKYAEWINVMVNILSGSGRSWALHEFFYSDIDRAWYVQVTGVVFDFFPSADQVCFVFFTSGTISINFRWMWRSLGYLKQHALLVKSGVLFVEACASVHDVSLVASFKANLQSFASTGTLFEPSSIQEFPCQISAFKYLLISKSGPQ